jgi:hypothetical protein
MQAARAVNPDLSHLSAACEEMADQQRGGSHGLMRPFSRPNLFHAVQPKPSTKMTVVQSFSWMVYAVLHGKGWGG